MPLLPLICMKNLVIEEEFTEIFQEAAYNMFSPISEEKGHKIVCSSLQDADVFWSPIFDNYEDEEEQISTTNYVDLSSSQPIYDSYESDFDEPFSFPIKEQHLVKINHYMFVADIKYDKFNLPKDLRSSLLFATSHEQKTDIIIEKDIKQ